MAMTNFRRSTMVNSQQKGKGGGGNWYDKYTLPKANPAPFALINAEYIDQNPDQKLVEIGPDGKPLPVKNAFYKYPAHKRKTFKNGNEWFVDEPCSKGTNPHNPQPCAGCTAMDMGDKTVTLSDKFIFGLVHMSPYHRHPLYDKDGNIRVKDNKEPIFTYSECDGRTCNFCRILAGQQPVQPTGPKAKKFPNYNPADIKTEFGHRRYIEVGKGHLSNLGGWDASVSSQCSTLLRDANGALIARCGQQLTQDSFNCPQCGSVVIDVSTDPRSDEEIAKAVADKYPCLKCQKGVMLQEISSCDACAGRKLPSSQLNMFDVVLWGKREGEGTKSQLMLSNFQTIEEFQRSLPPHIQQMLGGKTVSDIFKELGTPYDFEKIFAPRTWEEQCKNLDLNLQQPGQQTHYNQQPAQAQGQPGQGQWADYASGPQAPAGAVPYLPPGNSQPGPMGPQPLMQPNFKK